MVSFEWNLRIFPTYSKVRITLNSVINRTKEKSCSITILCSLYGYTFRISYRKIIWVLTFDSPDVIIMGNHSNNSFSCGTVCFKTVLNIRFRDCAPDSARGVKSRVAVILLPWSKLTPSKIPRAFLSCVHPQMSRACQFNVCWNSNLNPSIFFFKSIQSCLC